MLIQVNELQPGNKLAQDIVMPSGRTLMTSGMVLTGSMIELIKKRNFNEIAIDQNSIQEKSLSEKVFTSDVLINSTMQSFKEYVDSRDDYFSLITNKGIQ